MKTALRVRRADDFSRWYQEVIRAADLAEASVVRGCMVIKPQGYGIWERMQQELDRRFKETGHENCYFPLFIPLSFIEKEARHVDVFAKEMAIVTHHRLIRIGEKLLPDPAAKLAEPLIVRPTSETIIGDSFRRWINTHKDLPILLNQWANVVRWEMRTRLFLRTTEFLWQEGHTAHANEHEAMAETLRMLEIYREFAEGVMAMPVIVGEKPSHERFAGANNTFSIEAMMQDGKALQAGTSHYLGTNFAKAQNITYRAADQSEHFVHTTSWGVSTRLIGGLIMSHGDDDGIRLPPILAPHQIVIIPRLRGVGSDAATLEYCTELMATLRNQSAFDAPLRVHMDIKDRPAGDKRWDWVRRGAPILVEIGPRDTKSREVSFIRRDQLRQGEIVQIWNDSAAAFPRNAPGILADIQASLYRQAHDRTQGAILDGLDDWRALEEYFGAADNQEDDDGLGEEELISPNPPLRSVDFRPALGWVRASWSRPSGQALEDVEALLRSLRLSIRVAPMQQPERHGRCVFTGEPGHEEILIARAY